MERRGKKLLGPGVVAAISNVEGGLAATATLPKTDNAWPRDGDGVGTRGVRCVGVGVGARGRERERSYYSPEDKRKNKWVPQ